MQSMRIATKASNFQSTDEVLVSWDVHGHFADDEDTGHNWQFQSMVIATIAEAEDFCARLMVAIAGAKERQAAFVASKAAAVSDGEKKADK